MALQVVDSTVAVAVAASTTQPTQRAAAIAAFGGLGVTVRWYAGATLVETSTHDPVVPNALTPLGFNAGPLLASVQVVSGATVTHAIWRSFAGTDVLRFEASDMSPNPIVTQTGRRLNAADLIAAKMLVTAKASLPLSSTPVFALTFALADTATVNVAVAGSIVNTGNQPLPWSITPPAGITVTPSSGTLAAGATQTLSVTPGSGVAPGSYSLTLVAPGATISGGNPQALAVVAPGVLPTLTLTGSDGVAKPFTAGHAFKQGDVPAGSSVVATGASANVQATIKNTWPDGSAKLAIIAGTATISGGTAALTLASGAEATGTPLTTADLIATGVTAAVDAGAFGSAAFGNTEWAAPFMSWVSGPRMSSWVYRKAVGSDAHLVAWLEVRLYAGGAVEVLPWVENGYIRVAGQVNKSATYTFALGGTSRFSAAIDLPARCRTPLVSGAALSHWLGADPGVTPRHDAAYLQSTRLVPKYRATVATDAARVAALPATFTPLQQGSYNANMAGTGYQPAIGLLPEWDALYLTTTAPAAYGGVVRNAYSAGRYNLHYRDENTNRPLRFSQFPNTSVNASTVSDFPESATGTAPPVWDIPHHPSVGYMAYLVTGRFFHMETVQFAAARNYLAQVDNQRQFAGGVFLSTSGAATTRGAAWGVRTLLQAATVTPDADTALRAEFVASLEANITFNHGRYVAQANNPFGIVAPYGDAYGTGSDGMVQEAPWQQDFYTAAFGYALAANPPISSGVKASLAAFFAWKAQSIIGRLGAAGATDWLYRDAAPFTFVVALVDLPDYTGGTGPWPASWRAMYDATYTVSPGAFEPGNLRGGNFPEVTSYWGNLQPAIAYAVEHGVSGASAAYLRMKEAANWSTLAAGFNTDPVWGISPPVEPGLPAWLPAAGVSAVIPDGGTTIGTATRAAGASSYPGAAGPDIVGPWSGATVVYIAGQPYLVAYGGGHNDSAFNGLVKFGPLFGVGSDTPTWSTFLAPSALGDVRDGATYLDGRQASHHTYNSIVGIGDRLYSVRTDGYYSVGSSSANGYYFTPAGQTAIANSIFGSNYVAAAPYNGKIYAIAGNSNFDRLRIYDPALDSWSSEASADIALSNYVCAAVDSTRGKLLVLGGPGGGAITTGAYWSLDTLARQTGIARPPDMSAALEYDPGRDKFVSFVSGSLAVYEADAAALAAGSGATWVARTFTGTAPAASPATGTFGRFRYVPELGGYVSAPSLEGDVCFRRST